MLALRSTCGLTDRTSVFLCLKGAGADPNLLISVMCLGPRTIGPLMLGGRGWLCQRCPRGTEDWSAPLCGAFRFAPPMWSAFLPVCLLSLDGILQCPSSSFACVLHRRSPGCLTHPAPQVRSLLCLIIITGMNRIEYFENCSGIH